MPQWVLAMCSFNSIDSCVAVLVTPEERYMLYMYFPLDQPLPTPRPNQWGVNSYGYMQTYSDTCHTWSQLNVNSFIVHSLMNVCRYGYMLELHSQREINSWAHHHFDSLAHELMPWTCVFLNRYSLFSPPIKKEVLTDGELLTIKRSFHFIMCLHRRIHIYIYILLSIERYKDQYNAHHCLYRFGRVNKTWQR